MPTSQSKLFQVRLSEAERRRIKILAVSQGLTLRQATIQAFEAWALQLQSGGAPSLDPLARAPAADFEQPGGQERAAKRDRRRADAKPSTTPGGGEAPNRETPTVAWLRRAAQLDWSKCPAAESVPGKAGNVWVVRGTRAPLAAIFKSLAQGYPFTEILELFGLTLQQLLAVLQFVAEGPMLPASAR